MLLNDSGFRTIAVLGLGYVGLPLAVEFGRLYATIGYDIDIVRVNELRSGTDHTLEVEADELRAADKLSFTHDLQDLREANIYIVTVPTPVNDHQHPDLTPLLNASRDVGQVIGQGDIVIFESTVYPGATEEDCIPVIEQTSGLVFNRDFFAGYSPERINPGDKQHRLPTIKKVTSGSTPEIADRVDELYAGIITAGTHKASCIRVAEASKVIENTQRDLNIALINELAMLFNRMGIDTEEVLLAAGTKWNFLPFRPGLVGGHCIGVDPYYLTYKAESLGYHPDIILAGRRINDGMGAYVATQLIKKMVKERIHAEGARVLIMGLSFKENCPDLRNTRVIDIIKELAEYHIETEVYDPWVAPDEAERAYQLTPVNQPQQNYYDAIIIAVAHQQFREMGAEKIHTFGRDSHILYDLKHLLPVKDSDLRL